MERTAAEKKVVRKVDFIVLPILMITLGLQYYDKAVLGSAAVFGILEDLDLIQKIHGKPDTTRYATVSAAFYYGYIVSVLPWALIFARFPLAKTTSICVFVWGVTCLLTVACHSYHGILIQRIALGVAESAIPPAFVAITGLWYKPYEMASRMGMWYSAYGLANMCSGLINFGLGHAKVAHPWKVMYYFGGAATMAWAFVIWFILPDSPLEPGRFFSTEEKEILAKRFFESSGVREKQPFKMRQFWEAMVDVRTWIYTLMAAAIYMCNSAITAFGARIIKSWGYNSLQTIALLIPGGASTCIAIWFFCYFADKIRDSRTWLLAVSCIPVWVGAIVTWTSPAHPRVGPLIGFYMIASFGAPYVLLLTLASVNVGGSTKKAVTNGCVWIGYNVGNIASSYSVIASEVNVRYRSAWITLLASMAFTTIATFVLRWMYMRENKKRDEQSVEVAPTPPAVLTAAGAPAASGGEKELGEEETDDKRADRTDWENKAFRYCL